MNCIDLIDSIARRQLEVIKSQASLQEILTPNYGWENHRYKNHLFRQAHVEIFKQDKFGVVHCCVFPNYTDPSPIYGFDVISSEHKITGVFLDLSPVVTPVLPFLDLEVTKERNRPEWGDIFSEHWLAARPSYDELAVIGDAAVDLLVRYLNTLGNKGPIDKIISAQNHYCNQQQKNPHTRRALQNLIGSEKTEEFMTQILFPCVDS